MRIDEEEILRKELCGKRVDFYLEDDMFEIEGVAACEDDSIVVSELYAVGHVLKMCGDHLELQVKNKRVYARRPDTGKVFEMEINRIYENLNDPTAEDFLRMKENGVDQFFRKPTDTLVWFDSDEEKWTIEFNKINMYFSGIRTAYDSIGQLFEEHGAQMGGVWQAIFFTSTVDEGDGYGNDCR